MNLKPLFWVSPDIESIITDEKLHRAIDEVLNSSDDVPTFPMSGELKGRLMDLAWCNRQTIVDQMVGEVSKQLRERIESDLFKDHLGWAVDIFMESKGFVPPQPSKANDE